ncbi:tetratricopeptide repeat protein, partial [Actinomyces bowdenii]
MDLSLLPLGVQLANLLLRCAVIADSPTTEAVADAVADSDSLWDRLREMGRTETQKQRLDRAIAQELQKRLTPAMKQEQQEELRAAVTEVEVLLERIRADDTAVLEAARHPERFREYLRKRGAEQRANSIAEVAEPVFDDLRDIVADEFVRLAPGSERFQIAALIALLDGADEIRASQGRVEGRQIEHGEALGRIEAGVDGITKAVSQGRCGAIDSPIHFVNDLPAKAEGFVEREEYTSLCEHLDEGGTVVLAALEGMPGVGKSQIAAAYARRCEAESWPLVAWINAERRGDPDSGAPSGVDMGLAELAFQMGVSAVTQSPKDLARAAINAVSSMPVENKLIVFDNLESADDLLGRRPCGPGVRVIVTTNLRSSKLGKQITVETFTADQAVDYLLGLLPDCDAGAARDLAEFLGYLPVALNQAAATMISLRYSIVEYRDVLERRLLEQAVLREEGDPYPKSVGEALRLAYRSALERDDRVRQDSAVAEAARIQLGVLALLADSGVPASWLHRVLPDGAPDDFAARKALQHLRERSVVAVSEGGETVIIHRLQARVIREDMRADPQWGLRSIVSKVVDLLGGVFGAGADEPSRSDMIELINQIAAIGGQEDFHEFVESPGFIELLLSVQRRAEELGISARCVALSEVIDKILSAVGDDDHQALSLRNNLAGAYESVGDLGRAIPLYEQNLADRERVLGADHPSTL